MIFIIGRHSASKDFRTEFPDGKPVLKQAKRTFGVLDEAGGLDSRTEELV